MNISLCNLSMTFSISLYVSFVFLRLGFASLSLFGLGRFSCPRFSSPLTSGGPPQCLNSGPSSKPGVNRGLGSLFWGMLVIDFIFSFFFRCVLDLFSFNRLKVTNCPGHSSALYHTGSPSLCWPLAFSGSSSIPTWFSRPRLVTQ